MVDEQIAEIEKAAVELCQAFAKAQRETDVIGFLGAKDKFREKLRVILGEPPEAPTGE